MPHITYIQSTLSKKEDDIVKLAQATILAKWDRTLQIVYRSRTDRRIYNLKLMNIKDGISYALQRLDGEAHTPIYSNTPGTFMTEDFFNSKRVFGSLSDSEILGFFIYDGNALSDGLEDEGKKILEKYGVELNKDIDWDKNNDITSIHYTELLSLIRTYKDTGDEKYYAKIKALFGKDA